MGRQIIDYEKFKGLKIAVNTFWMGDKEGVQITTEKDYIQMGRDDAIIFFKKILDKLHHQIKSDLENPPWWQELHKKSSQIKRKKKKNDNGTK